MISFSSFGLLGFGEGLICVLFLSSLLLGLSHSLDSLYIPLGFELCGGE